MLICVNEDVLFAEAQSVHTLTTTIQQADFEICFVVNAIKLLDCYKTIFQLLKVFLNTCPSITLLTTVQTGKDNWKYVENGKERYFNAAMRHLTAWWEGEKKDPETGESHLAHTVCCLFFLLWLDNKENTE